MRDPRNAVQMKSGAARGAKGAGAGFIPFVRGFVEKVRQMFKAGWRLACLRFAGWWKQRTSHRSACGGLPLFLRFSGDRSLHGDTRIGKAWRRGNDIGKGRLRFREQSRGRIEHRANHFGGGHGRRLQGLVVIEHPSGEHGFGCLLNPLVDQGGNFLPQVGSVVEARQFKTLQRCAGSRLEIVERRSNPRYGHGQSSNLRAGPKGPATETLVHSTELSRSVSSPPLWICCGKCVKGGRGAGGRDVTRR
jgi:hypothetical protein